MATDSRDSSPAVILITGVSRNEGRKWYEVALSDGFSGKYPYVWLRDNCQCTACYNADCQQREFLLADLDADVRPESAALSDGGRALAVTWPGGHGSRYAADWLHRQRFAESEPDPVDRPEVRVWGSELSGAVPTFEYAALMGEDAALYDWLRAVQTTGLALVEGAPKRTGVCRELTARVAFFRKTIYGEEFQVQCKTDISNLGYTSKFLAFHSDLPYYENPPEVQLLHCIEQCKGPGGENQFVDGWNIVRQLKEEHPDAYKVLSGVPMDYKISASDQYPFHMKLRRPIIDFDVRGELCMRYNDPLRAPYMLTAVEDVTAVYDAIKLFNQVIYSPRNVVHHRLSEGEIVTFNNRRLLHGRNSFEMQPGNSRLLEGGYIDWDEVRSRMRVLRESILGLERL